MKRTVVYMLAMVLFLSACNALPSFQLPDSAPAVDVQATDAAMAETLAVETLNALPTPTLEPATDTPESTSTLTQTATATETSTATETLTPDPNVTTTDTSTAITATGTTTAVSVTPNTATSTVTGTPPTVTQSTTPSATETLYARFYGTLPPAIPYGKVKLTNKSKAEVYISMNCTTVDGYNTIIEYPVPGRLRVSAPAGKYTYVAWVGGRQFQGWFGLGNRGEVEITFNKDKVTIK
jgi:hypothetical protein